MLVLSRKQNQSLIIGDNIVITILSIDRDQIRLGIEAPKDIRIMRHELFDAVKEQEILAAKLSERKEAGAIEDLRKFLEQQVKEDETDK
ncbi:MAG: carbon storage regulator CsrA [Anaerolineae bacterium]|nr:carbon storage regulator CsrA [Anaerolineae bacterium]